MYETLMSTFHQQNINKMKMVQFLFSRWTSYFCHTTTDYLISWRWIMSCNERDQVGALSWLVHTKLRVPSIIFISSVYTNVIYFSFCICKQIHSCVYFTTLCNINITWNKLNWTEEDECKYRLQVCWRHDNTYHHSWNLEYSWQIHFVKLKWSSLTWTRMEKGPRPLTSWTMKNWNVLAFHIREECFDGDGGIRLRSKIMYCGCM